MSGFINWGDQTSETLAAMAADDPVAVLPVAAIEQHGPHLPLSTDAVIGEGLLDAASAVYNGMRPVLRLPMLSLGASVEHTGFPGTLSLSPERMAASIEAVGAGVARA
ncbi:creatininase family protein, partial [Salinisphaera sp. Q1T1-3]|uniref:creatininase family protein n=1 Tax=Salinisphaera sp. Q1T1-3 TaxID=2321229 RepID=UPI0018F57BBB